MTPMEFKALFDGYSEAMEGPPTAAQWDNTRLRVSEIDGKPTTRKVYIDRYLPAYRPYWHGHPQYTVYGSAAVTGSLGVRKTADYMVGSMAVSLKALGRAEYAA